MDIFWNCAFQFQLFPFFWGGGERTADPPSGIEPLVLYLLLDAAAHRILAKTLNSNQIYTNNYPVEDAFLPESNMAHGVSFTSSTLFPL